MGWSGGSFSRTNGTYSGANTWATDEANGFDIESARHDLHDEDLADGVNSCLNKDGSNSPSAHLNWLSTERSLNTVTGSSSNYVASLPNAPASYFTALNFKFKPNHTNTGASTINLNGLGAKDIKLISDLSGTKADPYAGQIRQGFPCEVFYDGTDFILINPQQMSWQDYTPTYGGGGSMTFTSVNTTVARWVKAGAVGMVRLAFDGTTGGSASNLITATLPPELVARSPSTHSANSASILDASAGSSIGGGQIFINTGNQTFQIFKPDATNWGLGTGRRVNANCVFELA